MSTLYLCKIELQVVARNKDHAMQLIEENIKSKKTGEDYGLVGMIKYGLREHGVDK